MAKILLMDDDSLIRDVVSEQIAYLGYEVVSVEDGEKAIDLYIRSKEKGEPFDLIIMDLTVNSGMDGKEAAKKIREFDKEVPIIVSTGYSEGEVVNNYEEYGFSGVLSKPFKMDELKESIEKTLGI